MRNLFHSCFIFCGILFSLLNAQTTIDFEDFTLPVDTFLNGSDLSGGFISQNLFLRNNYNTDFDSWVGWSISTKVDTVTPGFTNQYAAITGGGVNGSATYGVGYDFSGSNVLSFTDSTQQTVDSLYITNSTYAYLSMLNGDSFAKRFGGETGDDPDFFFVSFKGFKDGEMTEDSVAFYLADYRFEDNAEDYIVKDWNLVELASLGPVDSLSFTFYSSDTGAFGINTPLYFCVDDISLTPAVTSSNQPNISSLLTRAYPNPFQQEVTVVSEAIGKLGFTISNLNGQIVKEGSLLTGENKINLDHQAPGMYFLMTREGNPGAIKLIKK
ncbi:MAG: DUF4465 domain-containing protein [Bacteroidota bacterium]